jgi:hypothetical protein
MYSRCAALADAVVVFLVFLVLLVLLIHDKGASSDARAA